MTNLYPPLRSILLTLFLLSIIKIGIAQPYIFDGNNCDPAGGSMEWGVPDFMDGDDGLAGTSEILDIWADVQQDTLWFAISRESGGTATYVAFLDADCDEGTGPQEDGPSYGAEIAIGFEWQASSLFIEQELFIWNPNLNPNGKYQSVATLSQLGFQGDRVCGDVTTKREFGEFFVTVQDLIGIGFDPCLDCGAIRIPGFASLAGGDPNSATKDEAYPGQGQYIDELQINANPIADFILFQTNFCEGSIVDLDATTSTDDFPLNDVINFEWDFDYDGVTFDVDASTPITMNTYSVGTYDIALIAYDSLGCSDTIIQNIIVHDTLMLSCNVDSDVSCYGGTDGEISIGITGGLSPYDITWSNGATGTNLTGLTAGDYTVTVTGQAGCDPISCTLTITQPDSIDASAVNNCVDVAAGIVDVDLTVVGGTLPYTFLWSNGATTEDLSSVPAGTYSVQITDGNLCIQTLSVEAACCGLDVVCPPSIGGDFQCLADVPAIPSIDSIGFISLGGEILNPCAAVTVSLVETDNGGNGCINDTLKISRTYTVSDGTSSFDCEIVYNVIDDTAPSFDISPIDTTVLCTDDPQAVLDAWLLNYGYSSASDNCGGTVTMSTNPVGPIVLSDYNTPISIWFIASDGCGNMDSVQATFNVSCIGIAKQVADVQAAASGVDGNFDITFTFNVQNTGNTLLNNINVAEDLVLNYGGAFVSTTVPTVSNITVSDGIAPSVNGNYDGGVSDALVFIMNSGELNPSGILSFDITIEVDPDAAGAIYGASGGLENQATATGDDPNGNQVIDDSDSGTDPDGNNPGEPGDTGGTDDPTPLPLPAIGVAKTVSTAGPASSGVNGNFDVTYSFVIQNLGTTVLNNITLVDNLVDQIGGAFVNTTSPIIANIIASTGSIAPVANPLYDGGVSSDSIFNFASMGNLIQGGTITFDLTVEIDPDNANAIFSASGQLENQATAAGQDPDGNTISDDSDSGMDPGSNNPGEPGDTGGTDDPTPLDLPAIGIAKMVANAMPAISGIQGNFDVTYTFTIQNLGTTVLNNITVVDDLVTQLGGAFVSTTAPIVSNVIASSGSTAPIANTTYDGGVSSDSIFNFASMGNLIQGGTITFDLTIELDPDNVDAIYNADGQLANQATATGQDPDGNTITDDSDSGMDPGSNNPGEPGDTGGTDDPTPLDLPAIGIAKTVSNAMPASSGIQGNFDVTYTFTIQNLGTTDLNNITVVDDLVSQMGGAFVNTTSPIVSNIVASAGSTAPIANPSYDGGVSSDSIFNFASMGALIQGGIITFDLTIEIDPDNASAIYNINGDLENQATASGQDPDGNNISDDSDSGTDPSTDNPGEPGDTGSYDDPTPLALPAIGIAKTVANVIPVSSGTQGNFEVTYSFVVQNLGNTDLENILVSEDLLGQLGGAFVQTFLPIVNNLVTSGGTAPTVNSAYNGGISDANVFLMNTGFLNSGDSFSFDITIEIDPNATDAIYNSAGALENQATAYGNDPDGNTVEDLSDSGTDPNSSNPNEPGDTGGSDDPTPLLLPSIEIAKSAGTAVPSSDGIIGHFDVVYSFVLMNTGNVDLSNIVVIDNLINQLGSAFVSANFPQILNIVATGNGIAPVANPLYDGGITSDSIFNYASGGFLSPSDQITFDLQITVAPNAPGAPSPLLNQATATGTDPDGNDTSDDSDSGTDPEGTNPDDPGDMGGPDDPTLLEIPATIYCPADLTLDCPADIDTSNTGVAQAFGNCILGNTITITFTDDASGLNLCGGTGILIRTWIAEDPCGNADTCEQTITIQDTIAPIISFCPSDTIVDCGAELHPDLLGWPIAMDECSSIQSTFADDSTGFDGSCTNGILGTITRTFFIADECENVSTCEQIIQVQDTIAPILSFNDPFLDGYQSGDIIPYQCYGRSDDEWQLPMMDETSVLAIDNCANDGEITIEFTDMVLADGNCEIDGFLRRYQCTWTATDNCGNSSEIFFILEIIDTIAPVLENVPEDISVSCNEYPEPAIVTATDECLCAHIDMEETISSSNSDACINGRVITRTWTATDHCGNQSSASQQITVFDDAAPTITINHPLLAQMDQMTMNFDCNSGGLPAWFMELDESSVLALDFCSNDIDLNFEIIEELSQQCQGSGYLEKYTLIWSAADACGNTSSLEFIALVTDTVAPVVENIAEQLCLEDATISNLDYYDACSAAYVSFEDQQIETACGTGKAIQRTWLIQDECGNSTSFDQTILLDSVAPELIINIGGENYQSGDELVIDCSNNDLAAMDINSITAIDDCALELEMDFDIEVIESGDCSASSFKEKTRYTWTAMDACGNVSNLSLIITTVDQVAPLFKDNNAIITVECGIEIPSPNIVENCGSYDLSFVDESRGQNNCDTLEILERTYEAIDECGNSSKFTQTIIIVNSEGPSFAHLDSVICEEFTERVMAFDACANEMVVAELIETTVNERCGQKVNRYQATDQCGNISEFTQTIIYQDSIAPEIKVINPLLINILRGEEIPRVPMSNTSLMEQVNAFNKLDVYAIDECGVDPFILFTKTYSAYENCEDGVVGKLSFKWIALDACGNESELNAVVLIEDDIAPELENIPEDLSIICDDIPTSIVEANDNHSDVDMDFTEQIITTDKPGNFTIIRTWTATDACGNSASESQTIEVANDVILSCDIVLPNVVNCNSHNNLVFVNVSGNTGPYTYEWSVQNGDCLIQAGGTNDTMYFYHGFGDVTINVIITDINGCTTSCSIDVECQDKAQALVRNTSTENWISDISTYPNPVSTDLIVQLESNNSDQSELLIVNAIGQIVKMEKINLFKGKNKIEINVSDIPSGVYFIQFSERKVNKETIKFIKS